MIMTAKVRSLLKRADSVVFFFGDKPAGANNWDLNPVRVRLIFKKRPRVQGFHIIEEQWDSKYPAEYSIELTSSGRISGGRKGDPIKTYGNHWEYDRDNVYKPGGGAWCFVSSAFCGRFQGGLKSIPNGASVTWLVNLDNNNGYVAKAGLHADEFIAEHSKGSVLLDYTVVEHNTARFGYCHERDRKAA